MDLPSASSLKDFVSALAPGLIILGIRQRFLAGPIPSLQDRAIGYAAISAVYYALFAPLFAYLQGPLKLPLPFANAIEYFALPLVMGLVAAIATSQDWAQFLWAKIGLQPIHLIPTSWDYAFSRMPRGAYVIVTLSDGSTVAGVYGAGSFTSSSRDERDILIADVWEVHDGAWTQPESRKSILLCGRDIRSVEIFK